jgi:hypothetical protein
MHYYALAIVPAEGDLDALLAETMGPYDENEHLEDHYDEKYDETYQRNPRGLWDWYAVGGRWSGVLSGYEPSEDPKLTERCRLCHGTGLRDDDLGRHFRAQNPEYTCNGCAGSPGGPGRMPLWPTQWPRHGGDVISALEFTSRITEWTDEQMPYAVFAHGSESVTTKQRWTGEGFEQLHDDQGIRDVLVKILYARLQAGLTDRVVVIDYHS